MHGLNNSELPNQVCVIAIFSTIWYFVGGWFGGIKTCNPSSWTWTMVWHWMVAFPWIPALYTGIFSSGLCLWIEVLFLIYQHSGGIFEFRDLSCISFFFSAILSCCILQVNFFEKEKWKKSSCLNPNVLLGFGFIKSSPLHKV